MKQYIEIKGARTHNLKNISLSLPKNSLVVFTGLSGSGKSSLAFDTIYAEGQRRYVESLSSYARQFLGMMEKPDVDSIEGLSPAISIDQKTTSYNPRSTLGTVTEIYDYLRVLYARIGVPYCPYDGEKIEIQTVSQIVDQILSFPLNSRLQIMAPIIKERKGSHEKILKNLKQKGFVNILLNQELTSLEEDISLAKTKKHNIDLIVDRIILREQSDEMRARIADAVEIALKEGEGLVKVFNGEQEYIFSTLYACSKCGFSLPELHPRLFSFNLPLGACEKCNGLGSLLTAQPELILDFEKSILDGGILCVHDITNNKQYHSLLKKLSEEYGFKLKDPLKNLPSEAIDFLLHGSPRKSLKTKNKTNFEGFVNLIERRYKETDSEQVRRYYRYFMTAQDCSDCSGSRLKSYILHILIYEKSIHDVVNMNIADFYHWVSNLLLNPEESKIAEKLVKEIDSRLLFLMNVGLEYLTLSRRSDTLSGGELQRIRLATQIGTKLTGVLYVLDEPSIGLHQKDNDRLIKTLLNLKDIGNTLIVVEHDEQIIKEADFVVDIGPRAGVHGGEIVSSGTFSDILKNPNSLTALYLNNEKKIDIPKYIRKGSGKNIHLMNVKTHNLKNISCKFPLGKMIAVTGVSGSGKSSLINGTLLPAIHLQLGFKDKSLSQGNYKSIKGVEYIDKVVNIDQKPIGRTPRSNPATYTGVFTHIREIFALTNEAKVKGYQAGRFSFNVKGGRCEKCAGDGVRKIEMHFLADVYVTCEACQGKRYNQETLSVFYKGCNIFEILEMTIIEALEFFDNHPKIKNILSTVIDVGLDYLKLGQSATTLSGGEAQRMKLAKELCRQSTGKTLYLLDEPTTGLHFADVHKLVDVLNRLTDLGNTVITIEHNLEFIKVVDHIIDIGPDGGERGGEILVQGAPKVVIEDSKSYTGKYLREIFHKNV